MAWVFTISIEEVQVQIKFMLCKMKIIRIIGPLSLKDSKVFPQIIKAWQQKFKKVKHLVLEKVLFQTFMAKINWMINLEILGQFKQLTIDKLGRISKLLLKIRPDTLKLLNKQHSTPKYLLGQTSTQKSHPWNLVLRLLNFWVHRGSEDPKT